METRVNIFPKKKNGTIRYIVKSNRGSRWPVCDQFFLLPARLTFLFFFFCGDLAALGIGKKDRVSRCFIASCHH